MSVGKAFLVRLMCLLEKALLVRLTYALAVCCVAFKAYAAAGLPARSCIHPWRIRRKYPPASAIHGLQLA
jgi:hypothetical protein